MSWDTFLPAKLELNCYPTERFEILQDAMRDSGLKRLPASWDKLCERFATEINSCRLNLVPDDAAIT